MKDTALLWTLSALVAVNTIIVVLAYVSAVRESKEHSEAPRIGSLRQLTHRLWLYAISNDVTIRSIALATALGSLWSLIWLHWFWPTSRRSGCRPRCLDTTAPVENGSWRPQGDEERRFWLKSFILHVGAPLKR
jgi:hypothetical protein